MMRTLSMCAMLLLAISAWSQPIFKPMPITSNFTLPGLLFVEENQLSGDKILKEGVPYFGVWSTFELVRAKYIDVVYAGKGGAILAAGDSVDECYIYGMNLVTSRVVQIITEPIPNPWANKRQHEWVRPEQHLGAIVFAHNPPDSAFISVYNYSFALHEVKETKVAKYLFGEELGDDLHMRLAPDAQHIAYVTKPKPVPGMPDTFESALKIIHFSNMTVTDATSSIKTRVKGGIENAWPAFDFQIGSHVQYMTVDTTQMPSASQSKWLYKGVEIEVGTNSEIFSVTLPNPETSGTLYRHPYEYHMLYTHNTRPPTRYLADHEKSRSLLIFPEPEIFQASSKEDRLILKADGKTLIGFANPDTQFTQGVKSYFENYAFTLERTGNSGREVQIWFYDPYENLYAAGWTSNPISLIGVIENRDPMGNKI